MSKKSTARNDINNSKHTKTKSKTELKLVKSKTSNRSYLKHSDLRSSQFKEFLEKASFFAKTNNIDDYFSSGQISDNKNELARFFLEIVMGFEKDEFVPCIAINKNFPDYIPQSEDYYPWSLFVTESKNDVSEIYQNKALPYLKSDSAGKKNYVVIINFKRLGIFDFTHEVKRYSFDLMDIYKAFNKSLDEEVLKQWKLFLENFGPNSSEEKKKQRRGDIVKFAQPEEEILAFIKRFGHTPEFDKPIGWDGKNFKEVFKTKNLPFLTEEKCHIGDNEIASFENKLIWGDNLAVMRSLPSESIDLIYIDPPFFSGRNYNCIFGDDDEARTFRDIWDGGLPTYLAWLNARLWEMKRLLKPTGSLFVHLDWHACHYVKCELDKVFGYDNFVNEIIWCYDVGGKGRKFARKHDNIYWYSKSKNYFFNAKCAKEFGKPRKTGKESKGGRLGTDENGRPYQDKIVRKTGKIYRYYLDENKIPEDWWTSINSIQSSDKERIGYPTQKPEALLERIIKACSNEGDVVADFFSGGGTTAAVAEKLGRRWIACDVSRIAVSVARDRLQSISSKKAGIAPINKQAKYGFEVQSHGAYEKTIVQNLKDEDYLKFILQCYEATPKAIGQTIHGLKNNKAICVAPAKERLSVDLVGDFYFELSDYKINSGIILSWGWNKEVDEYVRELKDNHHNDNSPTIQLIQVKLVDIDSHEFKEDNIRFLNKPIAVIRYHQSEGLKFAFDGTASQGRNDTDIHCYQWDFNYKNRFVLSTKRKFDKSKDKDGDGNPLNDNRKTEHKFPKEGKYKVALRIIDKSGAKAIDVQEIDTKSYKKVA